MSNGRPRSAGGEVEIKECYSSVEITPATETRPPSPEPVAPSAGSRMDLVKQKLRAAKGKLSSIFSMARRPTRVENRDLVATTDRSIFELTAMVAPALTAGFQQHTATTNNNHAPQDDNNNQQTVIGIDLPIGYPEVPHADPIVMFTGVSPVHVTNALWTMSLLTLILDIATALSKLARGVVFEDNKYAYYIALVVIFVFGAIEAFTAFWMSRTRDPQRRRFKFGTVVLCSSIMPFVFVAAMFLAHIAN